MTQSFVDFNIIIKGQPEAYTIEAVGPRGIQVEPHLFRLLLSLEQQTILKDLTNDDVQVPPVIIQEIGHSLFKSLFADHMLLAFGQAQGRVGQKEGLRLRLRVEPSDLADIPWEAMYDGQSWLSAKSETPLVRILPAETNQKTLQKLQVRGALRILYIGASPLDKPKLRVEKTAQELQQLLKEVVSKKQIIFDVLYNPTLSELRDKLLQKYHVLYFAGHGSPRGIYLDDGEGIVDITTGQRQAGDSDLVSAETLAQALEGKPTRLLFLGACNTTAMEQQRSGLLSSFAQELVTLARLPAVVAMQYPIGDEQANELTARFFAALAAFQPVDVALAEARKSLIRQEEVGRDVIAPVMYLQTKDSALFQRARNWIAIGSTVFAILVLMALIAQTLFFRPDRRDIAAAQQTAQAEGTQRAIAQARGNAEATQRVIAEATAVAEATQRAMAEGTAVAEATKRVMAQSTAALVSNEREATFRKSGIIPTDELPRRLAFDGKHLWVIYYPRSSIDVFDIQTGQKLIQIDFGDKNGFVYDIIFDGRFIWSAGKNENSSFLRAIDPETMKHVHNINLSPSHVLPTSIASDGKKIWIAHYDKSNNTNFINAYDPEKNQFLDKLFFDETINSIVYTGNEITVADDSRSISFIAPNENRVTKRMSVEAFPQDLYYSADFLWVIDRNSNRIQAIRVSSKIAGPPFAVGKSPVSAAFDGSLLWVANKDESTVQVIDTQSNSVMFSFPVGESPEDILFDGENIWVAARDAGFVQVLRQDSKNTFPSNFPVGLPIQLDTKPVSFAFDGELLWVATVAQTEKGADSNGYFLVVDPFSKQLVKTYPLPIIPIAIELIGSNIWLSSQNSTIISFDTIIEEFGIPVKINGRSGDLEFDGKHLWVTSYDNSEVQIVDIESNEILGAVKTTDIEPYRLVYDGQYIWVGTRSTLNRIDPIKREVTNEITFSLDRATDLSTGQELIFRSITDFTSDGDQLWTIGPGEGILKSFDPETGDELKSIDFNSYPEVRDDPCKGGYSKIVAFEENIFVSLLTCNEVLGINKNTEKFLGQFRTGYGTDELFYDGFQLWVANELEKSIQPILVEAITE